MKKQFSIVVLNDFRLIKDYEFDATDAEASAVFRDETRLGGSVLLYEKRGGWWKQVCAQIVND